MGRTEALRRVLASRSFVKSPRLRAFLTLAVERAAAETGPPLKEYEIGTKVYGRPSDFDPRADGIVRVEATRLRHKLREYYETEGREDALRIELPRGTYTPAFSGGTVPAAPAQSRGIRPVWIAAAAVVLVSAAGAAVAFRPLAMVSGRRSVAVLGFRNLSGSGDVAWLDTALTEMIASEISEPGRVRVAAPETVAQIKRESADADGALTPDGLVRLRRRISADLLVTGAYAVIGAVPEREIRADIWLRDARSGEAIATLSESGPERELFALTERVGVRLRQTLGIRAGTRPTPLPRGSDAMRLYAQGLDAARHYDPVAARRMLEQAVAADSSNALAHSALAEICFGLGYEVKAEAEARRAFELSAQLSPAERLEVEGRYRRYAHQWDRAVECGRRLYELSPDDLDSGLRLAEFQRWANRLHDALASVTHLRNAPHSLLDDARLDLAEAGIYGDLSQNRRTRDLAATAVDKARRAGSRDLEAQAMMLQSGAMQNLVEPGVREIRAQARRICEEIGDRACVLKALRVEGNYQLLVDPAAAERSYQEGLALAREIGAVHEQCNILAGLGALYLNRGDLPRAAEVYAESLELARPLGQKLSAAAAELNLSDIWIAQGRLREAKGALSDAWKDASETGNPELEGLTLLGLARVADAEGQPGAAASRIREAYGLFEKTGSPEFIRAVLIAWGDVLLMQGDVAGARQKYQAAPGNTAWTSFSLARLALASGDGRSGAELAARAVSAFAAAGVSHERALAQTLLAQALARQGKPEEAIKALDSAEALAVKSGRPLTRFAVAAVSAELHHGSVEAVLREAQRAGFAAAVVLMVPDRAPATE